MGSTTETPTTNTLRPVHTVLYNNATAQTIYGDRAKTLSQHTTVIRGSCLLQLFRLSSPENRAGMKQGYTQDQNFTSANISGVRFRLYGGQKGQGLITPTRVVSCLSN